MRSLAPLLRVLVAMPACVIPAVAVWACGDAQSIDATATSTAPLPPTATPMASLTPAATSASTVAAIVPATPPPATPRPAPPTATPPPARGEIVFSPGERLTAEDVAARGSGAPGRGAFTGERLLIPRLYIDMPLEAVAVGPDGMMPSPPNIDTAVWYDFSAWPGLGGTPGIGGNVVVAGDSGRFGVGIGPLYKIIRMTPGDYAMVRLTSGAVLCYRAEFNKVADPGVFGMAMQATPEESLTLITAATEPTDRRLVWGRRVDCSTAPTPTPTALAGHHKLRMVAENRTFTIVDGGTVPPERHTVDFTVEIRDRTRHSISFYDTTGRELIATEPVDGPITMSGAFGVGPPQAPGAYTFRCSVYPEMTGTIDVRS
jgi:hypothetical protein